MSVDRIYKREPVGLVAFQYFRELRNKHFVHDENSYAQSLPAAVLNKGDKGYKIEKIVCLNVESETLEQANFSNLKLLISKARAATVAEFEAGCNALTQELEREPYESLAARRDLSFRAPTVDEIRKNRRTM